jgi:hypothetical protein
MNYNYRAKHYAKNNLHQQIIYNAAERGVGLTNVPAGRNWRIYPVEDLIIKILDYSKLSRLIQGIPAIIYKNKINFKKLTRDAVQHNVANETGYVLQMTHRLFKERKQAPAKMTEIEKAILALEAQKDGKDHLMLRNFVPNLEGVLKQLQLPEEKHWRVLGRLTYNDFAHAYSCCG